MWKSKKKSSIYLYSERKIFCLVNNLSCRGGYLDVNLLLVKIPYSRMESKEEILFTKKMRDVTKEIHGVSDALINAKIGFGKRC